MDELFESVFAKWVENLGPNPIPDLANEEHLYELKQVMLEHGIPEEVVDDICEAI